MINSAWNTKPGIHDNIPNAVYHADRICASRSWIKTLIEKTPLHLKHEIEGPPEPRKQHFEIGSAFHTMLLEPDKWRDDVIVLPELNLRLKKDRELRDSFYFYYPDKTIITPDQYFTAQRMYDSVMMHPRARKLFEMDFTPERTIVWRDTQELRDSIQEYSNEDIPPATDLLCKCRPDAMLDVNETNWWIDIKTSRNAHPYWFARDAEKFGYGLQPPYYMDGGIFHGIRPDHFIFIVTETEPPYATAVYRVADTVVEEGRMQYMKQLAILRECVTSGIWPGYKTDLIELDLPYWFYKETAT